MSTRLEISLDAAELAAMERIAHRYGFSASTWAAQAVRRAMREDTTTVQSRKLAALREAAGYAFPVGGIDLMLREIQRIS